MQSQCYIKLQKCESKIFYKLVLDMFDRFVEVAFDVLAPASGMHAVV